MTLEAEKELVLGKCFLQINSDAQGKVKASTKRLKYTRNDAVQLQHQVIALLPPASSIFQLLLLLVVTVRIKQARPDRMRSRFFPAYLLN